MKSVSEIAEWLQRVDALVGVALEQQGQMAQVRAAQQIAEAVGNQKSLVGHQQNLAIGERQVAQLVALIRQETRRSLEDSVMLITDVRVRLERTRELYQQWRVSEAILEFAQANTQQMVDEENGDVGKVAAALANVETAVIRAKVAYETQLELTARLIPEPTSLILV